MNTLQKIYENEILNYLKNNSRYNQTKELCSFNAQKGNRYNHKLMIIGRAVNGWGNDFSLQTLEPSKLAQQVYKKATNKTCPLQWVIDSWGDTEDYNTAKSAFWRIAKRISKEFNLYGNDVDHWASYIVWSNLYKIAPSNGGNPSDMLCDEQFDGCNQLLQEELRYYQPQKILFLTGFNWFEGFLTQHIKCLTKIDSESFVDAYGKLEIEGKIIDFVIAKHPQGKNESIFNDSVLASFNQLEPQNVPLKMYQ
ncbi:hypothetical protein HWA77_25310 [Photobacterium damselae subsp. damselae]|uniref:Uncharacterized protein n=1 Tax=Photobacterium damselae subsp. damselae TaxID=85581 RepID=A0A850R4V8_PHODD|nr:hypothetical protein [Photobacterium damselae subsp. damselae]